MPTETQERPVIPSTHLAPAEKSAHIVVGELIGATKEHCLGTCDLGPTVMTTKYGPDGPTELAITSCREHCAHAMDCALSNALRDPNSRYAKAHARSGEPFHTTDWYDT